MEKPPIIVTAKQLTGLEPKTHAEITRDFFTFLCQKNPDITYISNLLQKDVFIENVPTCGIISIRFEIDLWKDIEIGGKLNFFDYPKK